MFYRYLVLHLEGIVEDVRAETLEDQLLVPGPRLPAEALVESERFRRFPGIRQQQ